MSRESRSLKRAGFGLLSGLALIFPGAVKVAAQTGAEVGTGTPAEELAKNWFNVCEGAIQGTPFYDRCSEILQRSGPGGSDPLSAALGNNLGVIGAQGRLNRQKQEPFINWDLGSYNLVFTANGGGMDRTGSAFENGFDSMFHGVLLGIDYLLSRRYVAGLTVAYAATDADMVRNAGGVDTHLFGVTSYGGYSITDDVQVEGYLGLGKQSYESARTILYDVIVNLGQPNQMTLRVGGTAEGETDGSQLNGGASINWDLHRGATTLSPHLKLDYLRTSIDGFTETDDLGLAMSFEDQTIRSVTTSLGAGISRAISYDWGVLLPVVSGDYVHEFQDDSREIAASFAQDPAGFPIVIRTESPDRDFFTAGASLVAVMPGGFSFFARLDGVLAHRFIDETNASLGFRAEL